MSSTYVGNSDGLVTGLCPAPPPPPPPPPVPGHVAPMRINTVETSMKRPQIVGSNDAYEPPAAIQNAMLTKDKKPFTYTPGMGGKLDLSQIRSPRMARRVAKNANDEGIEGPPKSALEPKPTPAQSTGANLFVQPQVAVPVFPTNVPPLSPVNRTPPTPPIAKQAPPSASEKPTEPPKPVTKVETKVAPITITSVQPSSPESPGTPTQVTLTKAPTPWLQNKNKPQEELPEWAKRSSVNKQSPSPDSPTLQTVYVPIQQTQQPQWQQTQQKQQPVQSRPQAQPYQYQQQQPQVYQYPQQQPQQYNQQQQKRSFTSPTVVQQPSPQQQERVIPIRIEDRPSVFDVKHDAGHHQFKQPPSPHHQQRWGQQGPIQNQVQHQPIVSPQQSTGGGYIIPIMVESSDNKKHGGTGSNASHSEPIIKNNTMENQNIKIVQQRGPGVAQQSESGPVQSRSFRVLQKITDTDATNDVDPEQLRKLQLTEDDRILMNKFKEQVDSDAYLHHEEDPRYRGAAIPSRAFRFLQTMTDSGEAPVAVTTPRMQNAINKKQNRNSKSFEETQANLPPSEQQVPEPKKYMGSAIPSRSFRILQAMTAPESVATQENRQADYTCQTENNVPGNQQGVFFPPCPPPFWNPEGGWCCYYPLSYPNDPKAPFDHPFPYHHEATPYVYYPIYNQNYPSYSQYNPLNAEKNACTNLYPQYVLPGPPRSNPSNCNHLYEQINASDSGTIVEDNRLQGRENKVLNENTNLNLLPQWRRANNMSRTASSNSNKDSECTTAMNITDEEEIPEAMVASEKDENAGQELEGKNCPSLNVNVPNYTYIDTSDSSDSTDSETHSDNESIMESSKISSRNTTSDNTSSDSDDSDSYLAYSTGLNPHGRFEKNSTPFDCSKEESRVEKRVSGSEDVDSKRKIEAAGEKLQNEANFPHQLSVIYEDVEQADHSQERNWIGRPFEAVDDPPDDTTTVSVSLPLRFKFSVSENNEDVTTVIVGDSILKPEKSENRLCKDNGERRVDDVSVDFRISADTSVDFTVKRDTLEEKTEGIDGIHDERIREGKDRIEEIEDNNVIPHVNFTLRKNPSRLGRINFEENVETEFTIKSKKAARNDETEKDRVEDQLRKSLSNHLNDVPFEANLLREKDEEEDLAENQFEVRDINKNIVKPEVVVSECCWAEDKMEEGLLDAKLTNRERFSASLDEDRAMEVEEKPGKEPKHLLSVQNSREETDDEDSGVTSDMSRMISEVDTDSECASSRNIRKYQRTQTHSRLFKLLNDDSILAEDSTEILSESSPRREFLSLPLKSNAFNYDDNYCSNYSSGLTSPEYSPSCEQSWRRLHDSEGGHPLARQDRVSCKEDPYYQAWKTPKSTSDNDVVPSLAFKLLENRRPLWSYKVNVLCPRIKSTKSVPRTLRNKSSSGSSVASSDPSSYVNLRTDHC